MTTKPTYITAKQIRTEIKYWEGQADDAAKQRKEALLIVRELKEDLEDVKDDLSLYGESRVMWVMLKEAR